MQLSGGNKGCKFSKKGCENLNILYVCHFWEKGYKFSNKRCGNLNTYRYCRYVCLKKRNASFPKRGCKNLNTKYVGKCHYRKKGIRVFKKGCENLQAVQA